VASRGQFIQGQSHWGSHIPIKNNLNRAVGTCQLGEMRNSRFVSVSVWGFLVNRQPFNLFPKTTRKRGFLEFGKKSDAGK